jgi:hypothetical protein
MIVPSKPCLALIALVFAASPLAAASPEFRSDDLPGATIHRAADQVHRSDTIELTLAPATQSGSRLEYKVHMEAGNVLLYALAASDAVVSEFHGESDANKAVMFYREEPATAESYGQFVAPMTGVHGWYLANQSSAPVAIRLTISGYYTPTPGLITIGSPAQR